MIAAVSAVALPAPTEPCTTTTVAYVAPVATTEYAAPVAETTEPCTTTVAYVAPVETAAPVVETPEDLECDETAAAVTVPTGYSDVAALADQYQETELPGYDISSASTYSVGLLGLLALAL